MGRINIPVSEFTRADARATKFSGIRSDKHLENMEIWIEGVLREDISAEDVALNPRAVPEAYARVLGLDAEDVKLLGAD